MLNYKANSAIRESNILLEVGGIHPKSFGLSEAFYHLKGVPEKYTMACVVSSSIFLRNTLEEDLLALYDRLVDLGMKYRDSHVYLADLENLHVVDGR
jgi:hypothetical protein